MKVPVFALLANISLAVLGADAISFSTPKDVDAARISLRTMGIEAFLTEALKQNAAMPRIHSKFWVDRMPQDDTDKQLLERSIRDFGKELAGQISDRAIYVFEHPDKKEELARHEWFSGLASWVIKPGGYENFRIMRRCEGIAAVLLARLIADPDVANEKIEELFAAFPADKERVKIRVDILFEESKGLVDFRKKIHLADEYPGFAYLWGQLSKPANRRFGTLKLIDYSVYESELRGEDEKLVFFCDDIDTAEPRTVVSSWDKKQHVATCVYGNRLFNLQAMKDYYLFRKVLGEFPKFPRVDCSRDEYHEYCQQIWSPYRKEYGPVYGAAATYYYKVVHNTFADFETDELIQYYKKHPRDKK